MTVAPRTVRPMIERKVPGVDAWELLDGDGTVLGRIERRTIGRGHTAFWMAHGVHPVDGRLIPLELSADREERVQTILAFRANPEAYRQHYRP